ncbi:MAG: hypothetical protein Q9170_007770 [Blastenia crenularia]
MPGPRAGTMNWDDTADKNLLLQIIAGQDVRVDYTLLAPAFGCTVSAVKQRVLKLKRDAKAHGFALKPTDVSSAGNETDSPQKPKAAKAKAANGKGKDGDETATPSKKRGRKADGDAKGSPAKKAKKGIETSVAGGGKGDGGKKGNVKMEPAEGEGGSRASSEATTVKVEGRDEDEDAGGKDHAVGEEGGDEA